MGQSEGGAASQDGPRGSLLWGPADRLGTGLSGERVKSCGAGVLQQLLEKTLAQSGTNSPGASSLISPCPLPSAMAVESFTATAPFVQIGRFFLSAGMSWAPAGSWAKQRPSPPLATPAVGVTSRIGPVLWAKLTPFLASLRRGQNEAWGHGTPSLGHCWAEPLREVLTPAVPESLGDIQHGAGM